MQRIPSPLLRLWLAHCVKFIAFFFVFHFSITIETTLAINRMSMLFSLLCMFANQIWFQLIGIVSWFNPQKKWIQSMCTHLLLCTVWFHWKQAYFAVVAFCLCVTIIIIIISVRLIGRLVSSCCYRTFHISTQIYRIAHAFTPLKIANVEHHLSC